MSTLTRTLMRRPWAWAWAGTSTTLTSTLTRCTHHSTTTSATATRAVVRSIHSSSSASLGRKGSSSSTTTSTSTSRTGTGKHLPGDPQHHEAVNNLLYNVSQTEPRSSKPSRRTLCALVANEPGVLSRVAGCLAGRGVNIDSLVVGETETPGLSRMTIVLKGSSDVDQARKQLEDLVQVWAVVEFAPHAPIVERELLLAKLSIHGPLATATATATTTATATATTSTGDAHDDDSAIVYPNLRFPVKPSLALSAHVQRQAIVELTTLFGGRVLDLSPDHIMVELTGKSMRIDAFIQLVRPFGIIELARSGALAMLRASVTGVSTRHSDASSSSVAVDESQLPPG